MLKTSFCHGDFYMEQQSLNKLVNIYHIKLATMKKYIYLSIAFLAFAMMSCKNVKTPEPETSGGPQNVENVQTETEDPKASSPSTQSEDKALLAKLRSWSHMEVKGDLDKDGVKDLVVMATPKGPEKINILDDTQGIEQNFNQPVLAIFFGEKDGGFRCFKKYDAVLPKIMDDNQMIESDLHISSKGVLQLVFQYYLTAGSWSADSCTYNFRYQDGDFFLIGEDWENYHRGSGEAEMVSFNYLTGKRQYVTYNKEDKNVSRKEKWSDLPKKPLRKLGAEKLYKPDDSPESCKNKLVPGDLSIYDDE